MKVYYYTIIAIGLIFLFYLAGISTSTTQLINFVSGNSPEGWESSSMWVYLIGTLIVAFGFTTIKVGFFGSSVQVTPESVMAAFVGFIFASFASSLYGILTYVRGISCEIDSAVSGCSWEYWVVWAVMIPFMTGYLISLVEFIRGSD